MQDIQTQTPITKSGAHWLLDALRDEGCEVLFGYPGGAIMPVYDALVDYPIKHILVRHEQGAALSADGYARVSGKVGVCMATSGPGATNLLTGIANAFMDSVPMLVITGQVSTNVMGTDAFQEVDIFGMSLPVVKHSYIVRRTEDVYAVVREAFEIARSKGLKGQLILAGDGVMRLTCELLRKRSDYKDFIHIKGAVSSNRARHFFEDADIYTQHNIKGEMSHQEECFGVSVVEAMSYGLPIVGTRSGGVMETVIDGENGILCNPGDVYAQADAFLRLANNPQLRQSLGDNGHNRVIDHFSIKRERDRLRSIMQIPK